MPKLSVKEAVQTAITFLSDLQVGTQNLEDVSVDEVELSDDSNIWTITIGYDPPGASMLRVTGQKSIRRFRTFKVNANTGEVISMKIREL